MGRAVSILLLIIPIVAACERAGQKEERAPLNTEVDSSGGVVRVRNYGQPPLWSLERIISVGSHGSLEMPRPDEFGRITSVTIGPQDRLYVADQYNYEVRVFDLSGQFLFQFGRAGRGPGEYGVLYSLGWVGDTLLALDLGGGRISEFDAEGTWLGQRRHPGRISGSPAKLRLFQVARDEVYAWTVEVVDRESRIGFRRHTPAGAEEVIWQASIESGPPGMVICDRPDGWIEYFDIPFSPKLVQQPAQNVTIAVAWTAEYRIAFLNSELDTVRVVEREAVPIPVSDAEWEAGLEDYRAFREEYSGVSCQPRSLSKPKRKPPIVDLHLDWTGRMWVEAVTQEGTVWEIFDPEGHLIGQIPSVRRSESVAPYFGSDYLAVVETDSLDVESVRVYRFTRPES